MLLGGKGSKPVLIDQLLMCLKVEGSVINCGSFSKRQAGRMGQAQDGGDEVNVVVGG